MSCRQCETCYDSGMCRMDDECEFYSPLSDEAESEELEAYVERERRAFYLEWAEYIAQCSD